MRDSQNYDHSSWMAMQSLTSKLYYPYYQHIFKCVSAFRHIEAVINMFCAHMVVTSKDIFYNHLFIVSEWGLEFCLFRYRCIYQQHWMLGSCKASRIFDSLTLWGLHLCIQSQLYIIICMHLALSMLFLATLLRCDIPGAWTGWS